MNVRLAIFKEEFARRGLKQADVATALGVSRQLITGWMNGRNQITSEQWKRLGELWEMDLFKIEKERVLASVTVKEPRRAGGGLSPELPIINAAPGGHSIDYEEPYVVPEDPQAMKDVYETFPRPFNSTHPQAFCVRVVGESMAPKLVPGDVVVCEPVFDEDDGQDRMLLNRIVFIRYGTAYETSDGNQEVPEEFAGKCCLAVWAKGDANKVTLKKLNPEYKGPTIKKAWIARLAVAVYQGHKL